MATVKHIRRRIRAVRNIAKITGAMKMIATARLKKAQDCAQAARPYAEKMRDLMRAVAGSTGDLSHPLLEVREENRTLFIVVGAQRGLAGSYNINVMHTALRAMGEREADSVKLFVIGKKAVSFFRKRPYEIALTLETPGASVGFADIRAISSAARSMFERAEVDSVYLVYARFISAVRQEPTVVKLLPIERPPAEEGISIEFIFEPTASRLLAALLPRYVDTQVYQAITEAQASEHGARMTAMSAATKNAGEMIDTLTLAYNKARQAAITKEITEITTSAEAQK